MFHHSHRRRACPQGWAFLQPSDLGAVSCGGSPRLGWTPAGGPSPVRRSDLGSSSAGSVAGAPGSFGRPCRARLCCAPCWAPVAHSGSFGMAAIATARRSLAPAVLCGPVSKCSPGARLRLVLGAVPCGATSPCAGCSGSARPYRRAAAPSLGRRPLAAAAPARLPPACARRRRGHSPAPLSPVLARPVCAAGVPPWWVVRRAPLALWAVPRVGRRPSPALRPRRQKAWRGTVRSPLAARRCGPRRGPRRLRYACLGPPLRGGRLCGAKGAAGGLCAVPPAGTNGKACRRCLGARCRPRAISPAILRQ